MKLTSVLKISESLLYDGFTPSKVKKGLIYNVATAEEKEVPPDVLEGMEFLDGFLQRVFNKISNS